MLGATLNVVDCPVPVNEPEEGVTLNHDAELETLAPQFKGHAQLPETVKISCCGVGSPPPCTALKASEPAEGCERPQGALIITLTSTSCGLPLTEFPASSVPLTVTLIAYGVVLGRRFVEVI